MQSKIYIIARHVFEDGTHLAEAVNEQVAERIAEALIAQEEKIQQGSYMTSGGQGRIRESESERMDELETIKQTGEIPVAMGCPCCKQSLAECECSMMTYDAEWLCFKHHQRGDWPTVSQNEGQN